MQESELKAFRTQLEIDKKKRSDACAAEIQAAIAEICKRHNCEYVLLVTKVPVGAGVFGDAAIARVVANEA